jgi:hypothetical protein
MPRITPSMAKNTIKRSLRAIVDRELSATEKTAIWNHFSSHCAYCGKELTREDREGHIDHLIPTTSGGTNHISNRVLSCPTCNGDEKREEDWKSFLNRKIVDPATREARIQRIQSWVQMHSHLKKPIDEGILERHIENVCNAFDTAVAALKG